jgi:hypothetical protein
MVDPHSSSVSTQYRAEFTLPGTLKTKRTNTNMRKTYGIISPDFRRIAYAYNLRNARRIIRRIIREYPDHHLRAVSRSYFLEGGTFGYDLPTFMACSSAVDLRPSRYYVGSCQQTYKREVFRSHDTPSERTFPEYAYVIGPFRTKKGAQFMADYGFANPLCQTVSDAERLARR